MPSAAQRQQKRDTPAPQFKAGLITPGQHRLSSLAQGLGQPLAKRSQARVGGKDCVGGGDHSVTPHRSPGAGREASPCLPDFALCNDVINHLHTCLGLWLSAGEPCFALAFPTFAR